MGAVIGIFSPKGGVGKTLLATNLAVAIGLGHRRKTILIDLNKGNGTADLLLDLDPDRSWSDLIPVIDELTLKHINFSVTEYRPGLDLLASPPEMALTEFFTMGYLSLLLDTLRSEYDLVILDTSSGNDIMASGSLALSDFRLFLLTPDIPSLRSISRLLATKPEREKKTGLIINQYSHGAPINLDEIKEHLGEPLLGVLPIDPGGVWSNISYGEPCVLRKSSKLGRSIRQLSARLLRIIDQREIQEANDDLGD